MPGGGHLNKKNQNNNHLSPEGETNPPLGRPVPDAGEVLSTSDRNRSWAQTGGTGTRASRTRCPDRTDTCLCAHDRLPHPVPLIL